jgi:protein-tyrosine-phosphatase
MPSVLFVCLGNICRSPMAEAVCRHLVQQRADADDWLIDSAGTGAWHVGEGPDRRTIAVCKQHGIPIGGSARKVRADDFNHFDHVLAMDTDNLANLHCFKGSAQVGLLGDYDPQGEREIGDPYYGGNDDFQQIYQQVRRSCEAFLASLKR